MESEKVKEIKKALECNADYEHHDKLSYIDGYKCKLVAYRDILTLISELESENETLRNAKVVYENVDYCAEDLKKAEKRIDELEKENAKWIKEVEDRKAEVLHLQEYGKKLIRETELKQFAERLKEKLNDIFSTPELDLIDETLKEFI